MFHCHVLLHADMGMTAAINYVAYSIPSEMGTRSGNMVEKYALLAPHPPANP
jgi:hypothetical protein